MSYKRYYFKIYNLEKRKLNLTNIILPSQHLFIGIKIFSSSFEEGDIFGIFCLKMQNDGNVVQYPVDTINSAEYAYYVAYMQNSTNRQRNLTRGNYVEKRIIFYMLKI